MSSLKDGNAGVLMSDLKDESVAILGEESSESTGEERAALIGKEEKANDSEVYSYRACLSARSCKIGLIVSIIALFFVLAALILILVAGLKGHLYTSCTGITLDDVFSDDLKITTYSGKWTDNGQLVHLSHTRGLLVFDPENNHSMAVISPEKMEEFSDQYGKVDDFQLSPTFTTINVEVLLLTNKEKVYRHSFLADYYLYRNGQVINMTKPQGLTDKQVQYAQWSPTGNHIAFVIGYNIYLFNPSSPEDEPVTVTTGGNENVYNGIPDWVYEEEVLSTNYALWWSEDGTGILFASFNDTFVRDYSFPEYESPDNQYTYIDSIPYPKPGTTNPTVSAYVANISNPSDITTRQLLAGELQAKQIDQYLVYAGWLDADTPYVGWLNRSQNAALFCTYTTTQDACQWAFTETSNDGWVELVQSPLVRVDDSGNARFFAIYPQNYEQDNYPHLAMIYTQKTPVFLTEAGPWHVTKILGVAGNDVLYTATKEGPGTRHIYSYSLTAKNSVCLTCSQEDWGILKSPNPSLPDSCEYFTTSCDKNLNHCLLSCKGPCVPFSLFVSFDPSDRSFKPVKFLEQNKHIHAAVSGLCLPEAHSFVVPADSAGGPALNGTMLQPPQFDSSKKYPVLVYVYGGPNSQTVDSTCILSSLSRLYFITELNIILVSVDGRGTGYRGQNFKFEVYKDLGHYETIDQLRAGRYLKGLSYIDGNHLGIMGSSYGGYMAAMVGSSGSQVYSAAISQSPVTDWIYYDSIYTERYMLEPNDNPVGYNKSSVLSRAEQLGDIHYLLVHGTGDDNVHFQHTAQLVEALTQADVQFRMQIYTDKAHSLSGGNTRRHLYELIADFLREHFYGF